MLSGKILQLYIFAAQMPFFFPVKDTTKIIKRQVTDWDKILANHIENAEECIKNSQNSKIRK